MLMSHFHQGLYFKRKETKKNENGHSMSTLKLVINGYISWKWTHLFKVSIKSIPFNYAQPSEVY